jgi:hypothetical protein
MLSIRLRLIIALFLPLIRHTTSPLANQIFVVLATSLVGTLFPIIAKRSTWNCPTAVFDFAKYFGSGVSLTVLRFFLAPMPLLCSLSSVLPSLESIL